MDELGFVHQHCIFHLEKNIKSNIGKKINEDVADYRLELKNTHPEYTKDEINENHKKEKRRSKIRNMGIYKRIH